MVIHLSFLHFNPLPPHGGRPCSGDFQIAAFVFQSTPSTRRETHFRCSSPTVLLFQSTPSTRRETHCVVLDCRFMAFQSTPSTRRETSQVQICDVVASHFNPLPPHGGRLRQACLLRSRCTFQSTPSTRRETASGVLASFALYISIHSLHTEGDYFSIMLFFYVFISIHSLHTEGDYRA